MKTRCGCCEDPLWLWPGGIRACFRCDDMERWPSMLLAQMRAVERAKKFIKEKR